VLSGECGSRLQRRARSRRVAADPLGGDASHPRFARGGPWTIDDLFERMASLRTTFAIARRRGMHAHPGFRARAASVPTPAPAEPMSHASADSTPIPDPDRKRPSLQSMRPGSHACDNPPRRSARRVADHRSPVAAWPEVSPERGGAPIQSQRRRAQGVGGVGLVRRSRARLCHCTLSGCTVSLNAPQSGLWSAARGSTARATLRRSRRKVENLLATCRYDRPALVRSAAGAIQCGL